jgi:outer membrane protein assembly factor BamD
MRKTLSLMLISVALGACSSGDLKDSATPEGAYAIAEEYEKDERYEEAIQKFREVQNKHPYSRYAVMAKLKVADINYLRENFIEAQNAYQLFKDLHPKHEKIDYVTFRLGMSYFNQLPSTIDRDLSQAHKAILYFDEVLTSYPKSAHAKEAADRKADALKKLAEKEKYIADFYFKHEQFDSALRRYEKVLKEYPTAGLDLWILYGASASALRTGEKEKGKLYANKLIQQFPGSSEASKIKNEMEKNGLR